MTNTRPTIALALGSGGARGLAHIPMLEVFDELGVRPAIVAGTSIGAIVGAAYCAGIPAKALRTHMLDTFRDRTEVMRRLIETRVGRITDMFSGLGNPLLVDGELVLANFWPEGIPEDFAELQIPFLAVATDYFRRSQVVFSDGPLRPAVAASLAIPGLVKPVTHRGHVLIDGVAVNPLPFDLLIGQAEYVIAIDVVGGVGPDHGRLPSGIEITIGTIQIMQEAIVNAKLQIDRPHAVLRPDVGAFAALDFFKAKQILAAGDASKDDLKRQIESLSGKKLIT
jgi:NTE family protein